MDNRGETSTAAGAGSLNQASQRRSATFSLSRSTSRIDQILETARERAESMTPPDSLSPRTPGSPTTTGRQDLRLSHHGSGGIDENTGLVGSQGNVRNFETIHTGNDNNGTTRRKAQSLRDQSRETSTIPEHETSDQNGNGSTERNKQPSWGKGVLQKFQSVELENKGSVARDHLALERTFLAWLRTSLAFASIGIAVTQLFRLNTSLSGGHEPDDGRTHALRHMGKPLGATFLGISILTLLLGYRRFIQGQEWVIKGKFPASRGTVIILVAVSFAVMVVSLVVVIVIQPSEGGGG